MSENAMDEEAVSLLNNEENSRPQSDSQLDNLVKGLEQKLAKAPESDPITTQTTTVTFTLPTSSVPLPTPTEAAVCMHPECISLAASIIDGMDTTKDPYGKWLEKNPLPAEKKAFGSFQQVQINNNLILTRILIDDKDIPSPDSETLGKLRKFYQSCLDVPRLNTLNNQPLLNVVDTIKKIFNGSSLVIDTLPSSRQRVFETDSRLKLTATLAYLHSRGINALFELSFDGDAAVDPNAMTLWFSQTELGLEAKVKEYYKDASVYEVYVSVLTRIFEVLKGEETPVIKLNYRNQRSFWPPFPWPPWGGDDDESDPKKTPRELAEAVVNFEARLAEVGLDPVSLQLDPMGTYNPVDHEELAELLPEIDFPIYWSSFAPRAFPSKIIVTYKKYLTSLSKLLSNTTSDVIEGYLVARTSLTLAQYLGPETDIWKAHRLLVETLTGISKGAVQNREEYCIDQVTDIDALGLAAGRFFALEAFSRESQVDTRNIVFNIIESFKESVSNLDWMDETSANAAAEKASNIRVNVGYPSTPNTESAQSIASYYSRLKIDEFDFFNNVLGSQLVPWHTRHIRHYTEMAVIGQTEGLRSFPGMFKALLFLAAFLTALIDLILFRPGYLKYGAFGAAASHELTHAFDPVGRYYDQNARLREWWSNATSEAFEERRSCLSRQYSSYTVDDGDGGIIHLNIDARYLTWCLTAALQGNLTSGEDIGDSGFIQAYRAWKKQYASSYENGYEYLLPGLNDFTREQLFFIAFARIWAENRTPQAARQSILTNPHTIPRYRTLGTLVNIPEFAEAFQCPVGSKVRLLSQFIQA
ncbi:hypothetical protein Clacol_006324 [Clathrus columnatus]|uniref:Endothelin-converting enzyme 1 n=1 Tax=Clathrus columnatus TaxID=1419009 RepID=A0AAV5AG27_9AGAM|nr:hypothetical protein Clacol_006324 [Clathrus columnatus]